LLHWHHFSAADLSRPGISGAELMYYGGTVVDVALAAVVMTQWCQSTGRALLREQRRTAVLAAAAARPIRRHRPPDFL
jgi:putative membrane protein